MARRGRIKAELNPQLEKDIHAALNAINKAAEGWGTELIGTPKLTMRMNDKSYRIHPVTPGQEVIFETAYLGKSQKIATCFKPLDAQPYDRLEFNGKELKQFLPDFLNHMASKLGFEDAFFTIDQMVNLLVQREVEERESEAEQKAKEQAAETANTYAKHPLFGLFA